MYEDDIDQARIITKYLENNYYEVACFIYSYRAQELSGTYLLCGRFNRFQID